MSNIYIIHIKNTHSVIASGIAVISVHQVQYDLVNLVLGSNFLSRPAPTYIPQRFTSSADFATYTH